MYKYGCHLWLSAIVCFFQNKDFDFCKAKPSNVPDASPSQMPFVPKETPDKHLREPLVAPGQVLTQQEGLTTSWDILVRN